MATFGLRSRTVLANRIEDPWPGTTTAYDEMSSSLGRVLVGYMYALSR
jgi:hypothetical protein